MLKLAKLLRVIADGKKTYGLGITGVVVLILEHFGYINLELTVGEQLLGWLGSLASMTMRAAVSKVAGNVPER